MQFQPFLLACALLSFASAQASAGSDCNSRQNGQQIEKGPYRLAFQTEPSNITVGKFFDLAISVCTTDRSPLPDGLKIDVIMPMHGHGMNYRPSVKRSAPGKFQATGLMMHMAGSWVLRFDVRQGDKATRLQTKITLK